MRAYKSLENNKIYFFGLGWKTGDRGEFRKHITDHLPYCTNTTV